MTEGGCIATALDHFKAGFDSTAAATAVVASAGAAAVEQDHGKDDQPNPVIVEEIAKTVVHNRSSE